MLFKHVVQLMTALLCAGSAFTAPVSGFPRGQPGLGARAVDIVNAFSHLERRSPSGYASDSSMPSLSSAGGSDDEDAPDPATISTVSDLKRVWNDPTALDTLIKLAEALLKKANRGAQLTEADEALGDVIAKRYKTPEAFINAATDRLIELASSNRPSGSGTQRRGSVSKSTTSKSNQNEKN